MRKLISISAQPWNAKATHAAPGDTTKKRLARIGDLTWLFCALGAHLFRTGDYTRAERYLRDAVRISPHLHEARLYLGATLVQKRSFDEALGHLAKVSSARPKWAAAHYYLSLALFGQRAYRSAKDELDAAVRYGYKPDPVFVEALNRQLIDE